MQETLIERSDPERLVKNPLVSVMMITYNHEPYIAQAIEGVVSQETNFPIELIIGEDCSTDRTREIVLEYQQRYPDIIRVLYSEKNVGAHENARRTGLAARGKFMAFCEGDDWWHRTDKLQIQIPFFLADDSLVYLSGEFQIISVQGQVIEHTRENSLSQQTVRVEYEDHIFETIPHQPCTVVARTDAVRRALEGDTLCSDHTQLMGDLPLCLELSQAGKMIHLNQTLASWRQTPNSATRQSDPLWAPRFQISSLSIRYRALELYPLPGGADRTSRAKTRLIRRTILMSAWLGDAAVARSQWRQLQGLGGKLDWKESACLVLAHIPLPRRSLTVAYRRITPRLVRMGLNARALYGERRVGPARWIGPRLRG